MSGLIFDVYKYFAEKLSHGPLAFVELANLHFLCIFEVWLEPCPQLLRVAAIPQEKKTNATQELFIQQNIAV